MKARDTSVVTVAVVCLTCWWVLSRRSPLPSPAALLAAPAIPLNNTITVPAGKEYKLAVSYPQDRSPGWLRGTWTVGGTSAGVRGAMDDTLVSYSLIGPDDSIIDRQDHPTSGNFSVRYTGGVYTFMFDNGGVFRSSPRVVTIEGSYQPD